MKNPDGFINCAVCSEASHDSFFHIFFFPASCFSDFKHLDEVERKYLLFPRSSLTGQLTLVFGGDTCLTGRLITRADI